MNKTLFVVFWTNGPKKYSNRKKCSKQIITLTPKIVSSISYNNAVHESLVMLLRKIK